MSDLVIRRGMRVLARADGVYTPAMALSPVLGTHVYDERGRAAATAGEHYVLLGFDGDPRPIRWPADDVAIPMEWEDE